MLYLLLTIALSLVVYGLVRYALPTKSKTTIVLIAAAILVVLLGLLYNADVMFANWLATHYLEKFGAVLAINKYLAGVLYAGLFGMALFLFWLLLIKKRRLSLFLGAIFSALPLAFGLILYSLSGRFSTTGEALSCYVLTTSGAKFLSLNSEGGNFDPETGKACKPLTPELYGRLVILNAQVKNGTSPISIDPNGRPWFSGASGEPVLWYANHEGRFVFFDAPWFDPETGRELLPVNNDVRNLWRKALEQAQREEDAKRIEKSVLAEQSSRKAEDERLKSLAAAYFVGGNWPDKSVVVSLDTDNTPGVVVRLVRAFLEEAGYSDRSSQLGRQFEADGMRGRIAVGDVSLFRQMPIPKGLAGIGILDLNEEVKTSSAYDNVVHIVVSGSLKVVDPRTGSTLLTKQLRLQGSGFTAQEAREQLH